jgi:putative colanic acid biosysnthesis UDP-glucose lipid carrier transferase
LRRTSLDELPQLFNVLSGEMSLVGPRPHALAHNVQYVENIVGYAARHKVKPGITGWAQVNGLRGNSEDIRDMIARAEADNWYIRNWSILLDLRILMATPFAILTQKNAL